MKDVGVSSSNWAFFQEKMASDRLGTSGVKGSPDKREQLPLLSDRMLNRAE